MDKRKSRPTFDIEIWKLQKQRGSRVSVPIQMMQSVGGVICDAKSDTPVSDHILRVMAHGRFEREFQKCCHHELAVRIYVSTMIGR